MSIDTYSKPLLERLSLQNTEDKMLGYKNVEVTSKCRPHNCSEGNDTLLMVGAGRQTAWKNNQNCSLLPRLDR